MLCQNVPLGVQFAPNLMAAVATDAPPKPLPVSDIIVGEIIAWRGWKIRNGYLSSFSQNTVWPPKEPVTGKVGSGEHDAGVYAFKDRRKLFDFLGGESQHMVWGSVALWGDVVEHELGYRAENAAIRSLDGWYPNSSADLSELRRTYGVHDA
jgi:hypothetical protein